MKQSPLRITHQSFEAVLVVLVLALHLVVVATPANSLMNWYTTDDAFYYFKVAQNISEGHGVTFDQFGRTNGFHPLWMLLCIPVFALARFDLVLPLRVLVLVMAGLNAATAVFIYRILQRVLTRPVAVLAGLSWALLPAFHGLTNKLGMETGLSICMLAWLVYLLSSPDLPGELAKGSSFRLWLPGIAGMLAVLSRLDNIFVVTILGVWLVYRSAGVQSASPNLRYYLIWDVVLAALAVPLSYTLRLGFVKQEFSSGLLILLGLSAAITVLTNALAGLYRGPVLYNWKQSLPRVALAEAVATAVVGGGMIGLTAALPSLPFPRAVIAINGLVAALLLMGSRVLVPFINGRMRESSSKLDWRAALRLGMLYFAPLAVGLAVYMSWSYWYFGTPMPVSGQIKQWWGTLEWTVYGRHVPSTIGFLYFLPFQMNGPWNLIENTVRSLALQIAQWTGWTTDLQEAALTWTANLVLGGLLLAWIWPVRKTAWQVSQRLGLVALFAGSSVQVIYYQVTGYIHTRPWYWIGEMFFLLLLAAVFLESTLQRLRLTGRRSLTVCIALAALVLIISLPKLYESTYFKAQPGEEEAYLAHTRHIEQATEPGSILGSTGGGVDAYFIRDRTVVNLDGLINSYEYFRELKQGDVSPYLDKIGVRYIYGSAYMLEESEPYNVLFHDRLVYLKDIDGTALYRYVPRQAGNP